MSTGRPLAAEVAAQFGLEGDVTALAAGRSSQAWLIGDHSVVRVPIPNSGRLLNYRSEKLLGDALHRAGAEAVASWRLVDVQGALCSIAPLLDGRRVDYGERWSDALAAGIATTLQTLHALPAVGYGPLANTTAELRGSSPTRYGGIVDRWFHAPIWPFDAVPFADHVVHVVAPEIDELARSRYDAILEAEAGPCGIVHSDLHREHILVDENGGLAGLLDFGDAFVGALAWDFALLSWYYGDHNAQLVASYYPGGEQLLRDGVTLAIAVGLYKLAKSPNDPALLARLRSTSI